jgi:hypothetical protein
MGGIVGAPKGRNEVNSNKTGNKNKLLTGEPLVYFNFVCVFKIIFYNNASYNF